MSKTVLATSGATWTKTTLAQKFIAVLLAVSLAFGMCPNVGFADSEVDADVETDSIALVDDQGVESNGDDSQISDDAVVPDNPEDSSQADEPEAGSNQPEPEATEPEAGTDVPELEADQPDKVDVPAKKELKTAAPVASYGIVTEDGANLAGQTIKSNAQLQLQLTWRQMDSFDFASEEADYSPEFTYALPEGLTFADESGEIVLPESYLEGGVYASESASAALAMGADELKMGVWSIQGGQLKVKFAQKKYFLTSGKVETAVNALEDIQVALDAQLTENVKAKDGKVTIDLPDGGQVSFSLEGEETEEAPVQEPKNKLKANKANVSMLLADEPAPTTFAEKKAVWVADDDFARPTDEVSLATLKSVIKLHVVKKNGSEIVATETITVPADALVTFVNDKLAVNNLPAQEIVRGGESEEDVTLALSYSIVFDDSSAASAVLAGMGVFLDPSSLSATAPLAFIEPVSFSSKVQVIDGANTTYDEGVYSHNDPFGADGFLTADSFTLSSSVNGKAVEVAGPTATSAWSDFDSATGVGSLNYAQTPKYIYDAASGTRQEVLYTLTIDAEGGYVAGAGDDQYQVSYDNTAVANRGFETDASYDGGTIKLLLRDETDFSATKLWLDPGSDAVKKDRPTATFQLYRFTNNKAGDVSEGFQKSSPVRDSAGANITFSVDGSTQDDQTALDERLNQVLGSLDKYDANGFEYVYFLRESMPGGAHYEIVFDNQDAGDASFADVVPGDVRAKGDSSIYNQSTVANRITDTVMAEATKTWTAGAYLDGIYDVQVTMKLQKRLKAMASDQDADQDADQAGADENAWEDTAITQDRSGFGSTAVSQSYSATMPKYDMGGKELEYRWVESEVRVVSEGEPGDNLLQSGMFTLPINVAHMSDNNEVQTIPNALGSEQVTRQNEEWFESVQDGNVVKNVLKGKVDQIINKHWEPNPETGFEASITVVVKGSDGSTRTVVLSNTGDSTVDGVPAENPGNPWIFDLRDLPKYDAEGKLITYTAEETAWPNNQQYNYDPTRTRNNLDTRQTDIYNVKEGEDGFDVKVRKEWIDDDDTGCRYSSYVKLVHENSAWESGVVELGTSNAWIEWVHVDAAQAAVDDNPDHYRLVEVSLKANPDESGAYLVEEGRGAVWGAVDVVTTDHHMYAVDYGVDSDGVKYTSNRRVGTVNITAKKTWVDEGVTQDGIRPASYVKLTADPKAGSSVVVTPSASVGADGSIKVMSGEKELVSWMGATMVNIERKLFDQQGEQRVECASSSNKQFVVAKDGTAVSPDEAEGTYTFEGLPKYDALGKVIDYSVEEVVASNAYHYAQSTVGYEYQGATGATPLSQESGQSEGFNLLALIGLADAGAGASIEEIDQLNVEYRNARQHSETVVFYKAWNDAYAYQKNYRPDIYVNLYSTTHMPEPAVTSVQSGDVDCGVLDVTKYPEYRTNVWSKNPSKSDATRYWMVSYENMPRYDSKGAYITYYASEEQSSDSSKFDYQNVSFLDGNGTVPEAPGVGDHKAAGHWIESVSGVDNPTLLKENGTFVNGIKSNVKLSGKKVWDWNGLTQGYKGEVPSITVTLKRAAENGEYETVKDPDGNDVALMNMIPDPRTSTTMKFSFEEQSDQEKWTQNGNNYNYSPEKYDADGNLYTYSFNEDIRVDATEGAEAGNSRSDFDLNDAFEMTVDTEHQIITNKFLWENYTGTLNLSKTWSDRDEDVAKGEHPYTKFEVYRAYLSPEDEANSSYNLMNASSSSGSATVKIGESTIAPAEWKAAEGDVAKLSDAAKKKLQFNDLPIYAPDGFQYVYYVVETVSGYQSAMALSSAAGVSAYTSHGAPAGAFQFTDPDGSVNPTATDTASNAYAPKFASISGTKSWTDQSNSFNTRPATAADLGIKIYREAAAQSGYANKIEKQEVTGLELTWNYSAGTDKWTWSIDGLDAWAPNGSKWKYTVEENLTGDTAKNYSKLSGSWAGTIGNVYDTSDEAAAHRQGIGTITNGLGETVQVKKTWDEAQDLTYHPNTYYELQVKLGDGAWQWAASTYPFSTWTSAPKEYNNQPWTKRIAGNSATAVKIERLPSAVKASADASAFQTVQYRFAEIHIDASGIGGTTAQDMVGTGETGHNGLLAENAAEGATSEIPYKDMGAGNYNVASQSTAKSSSTTTTSVKNKLSGGKVDLKITKVWEDLDNRYSVRPSSVVFALQRKIASDAVWANVTDEGSTTPKTFTVSASSWTRTVKDLPAKDAAGNAYLYRAVETVPGGYNMKSVSPADDETPAVPESGEAFETATTNELPLVSLTGTKVWNSKAAGVAADGHVTLTLQRKAADEGSWSTFAYKRDGSSTNNQPEWTGAGTEANPYTFTYTQLPALKTNGSAYAYRAVETATNTPVGYYTPAAPADPTLADDAYTQAAITNVISAFTMDKLDETGAQLKDDALEFQIKQGTALIATWTRGKDATAGTFELASGIPATSGDYRNVSLSSDATVIYGLPMGKQFDVLETKVPARFEKPIGAVASFTLNQNGTAPKVTQSGDARFAAAVDGNGTVDSPLSLTFKNVLYKGNVILTKNVSPSTNFSSKVVSFDMYKLGDGQTCDPNDGIDANIAKATKLNSASLVTDENGSWKSVDASDENVKDLLVGKYFIVETGVSAATTLPVEKDRIKAFEIQHNNADKVFNLNLTNPAFVATMTLTKLNGLDADGAKIKNATFNLMVVPEGSAEGAEAVTPEGVANPLTTGADGVISQALYQKGTYTLTEVAAPGCSAANLFAGTFTLTDENNGATVQIKDGASGPAVTKIAGEWSADGVKNTPIGFGVNKIMMKKSGESWVDDGDLADNRLQLTVKDSSSTTVFTWTRASNSDQSGHTVLSTGLTDRAAYVNAYVDEASQKVYGLPAGTYTVEETGVPFAFHKAETFIVTLAANGDVAVSGGDEDTAPSANSGIATMRNKPFEAELKWFKLDENNQGKLMDAQFKLQYATTEDGEYADYQTGISYDATAECYHVRITKKGWYQVVETTAPSGYKSVGTGKAIGKAQIVESNYAQTITFGGEGVVNTPSKLALNKTDDQGVTIGDADLELTIKESGENGQALLTWTRANATAAPVVTIVEGVSAQTKYQNVRVDADAIIYALPAGDYQVVETSSPTTYVTADPIDFTVHADGTISSDALASDDVTVVMEDVPYVAHVHLKKADVVNGQALAGATFELALLDPVTGEAATPQTKTTNAKGEITFDVAEKGIYTLTETAVPVGYNETASEFFACEFEMTDDEHEKTFEINKSNTKVEKTSGEWYQTSAIANKPLELQLGKVIDGTKPFDEDGLTLTLSCSGAGVSQNIATWTRAKNETGAYEGKWTIDAHITDQPDYQYLHASGQKLFALPAGVYTVTESDTLPQYELADPATFTLNVDGTVSDVSPEAYASAFSKDAGVTINNITFESGLMWTKKDANEASAHEVLETAEFKLQYQFHDGDDWADYETGITWNASKGVYFASIDKRGNYRIVETKAPAGYKQISAQELASEYGGRYCGMVAFANEQNGKAQSYEIDFGKSAITNVPSKVALDKQSKGASIGDGALELQITDADGALVYTWARESADAQPTITKGSGLADKYLYTYVAEDAGEKYIYALPAGTYTMTETGTPIEYVTAYPVAFTVSEDGSISSDVLADDGLTVVMEDVPFATTVSWTKQDVETGEPLSAEFELIGPKGAVEIVEEHEGSYSAELTARGVYTLTEVKKPEGYPEWAKNHFSATFEVQDVDNGKPVVVAEGRTTAENDATLPETATKKEFSEIVMTEGTWTTEAITNTRITGDFEFTKTGLYNETCADGSQVAALASTRLVGAEFALYADEECTEVAKNYKGEDLVAVSDPQTGIVKFTDILAAWNKDENSFQTTYYMKETVAPAGYKLMGTLFRLTMTGAQDDETLSADLSIAKLGEGEGVEVLSYTKSDDPLHPREYMIQNDVLRQELVLKKRSELDKDVLVEGATFGLFRQPLKQSAAQIDPLDGQDGEILVAEGVTDKNGMIRFEGLLADQAYTIRELAAPAGYLVSKKAIKVMLKANESDNGLEIAYDQTNLANGTAEIDAMTGEVLWNDPQTQIRINKVDAKGELLAGAKLHVEDADGSVVVKKWTSSDKEGQLITGLVAGETYFLVEDQAPDGYLKAEEPLAFEVNDAPRAAGENYIQVVKLKNKVDNGNGRECDHNPKTGDSKLPPLAAGFAAMLSAAVAVFAVRRRKDANGIQAQDMMGK